MKRAVNFVILSAPLASAWKESSSITASLVVDEYRGFAKVKLAAQFPIFNAFGDQNDTIEQLGSSSKAKAPGL